MWGELDPSAFAPNSHDKQPTGDLGKGAICMVAAYDVWSSQLWLKSKVIPDSLPVVKDARKKDLGAVNRL